MNFKLTPSRPLSTSDLTFRLPYADQITKVKATVLFYNYTDINMTCIIRQLLLSSWDTEIPRLCQLPCCRHCLVEMGSYSLSEILSGGNGQNLTTRYFILPFPLQQFWQTMISFPDYPGTFVRSTSDSDHRYKSWEI